MKAEDGHKDKPDYLASLKLLSRHMKDGRARFLGALLAATASAILELVPFWSIYRLASAIVAGDAEWTLFLIHAGISAVAILPGYSLFACPRFLRMWSLSTRSTACDRRRQGALGWP